MNMFRTLTAVLACTFALACLQAVQAAGCDMNQRYTLLVHGGFAKQRGKVRPDQLDLIREVVTRGRAQLADGAASLDVVVDAIVAMENSGLLDAGKGSYFNTAGFTENDASLMDGATGRSGAVAAMQRLKNPIRAARLVMDKTPHVFFAGTTGEATVIDLGAEVVPDPHSYFREYVAPAGGAGEPESEHGTVGAVALDRCGHLAAGTSTGGTHGKMPGRVGDSPIIGASTFADEHYALSATGIGEYFIKRSATRDIAMRAEYLNTPLQQAADYVIRTLIGEADKADGAIIAISAEGEIVLSSNGYGVLHGFASDTTPVTVGDEVKY